MYFYFMFISSIYSCKLRTCSNLVQLKREKSSLIDGFCYFWDPNCFWDPNYFWDPRVTSLLAVTVYFGVVGGRSVSVSAPMLLSLSMLLLSPGYAFVGKVSSVRASRSLGMLAQQTSGKPLTELCEISKQACEAVAPMLQGDVWCCILVDNVYSIL